MKIIENKGQALSSLYSNGKSGKDEVRVFKAWFQDSKRWIVKQESNGIEFRAFNSFKQARNYARRLK